MSDQLGLRERKKLETARTLWETAIGLFLEHGFDDVTVTQIAAAANVSKMTVFNYFPAKEDLVIRPLEPHVDEPARVVRDRARDESAVAALRRDFLDALARRDPSTGLNDTPGVLGVQRLLRDTPALTQRALALGRRSRRLLAEELARSTGSGGVLVDVAAAQLIGAREALVDENVRRVLGGESADGAYPDAVADAERAFDLLEAGLRGYGARS
ncbi:TetR family transcriptional regulator [Actinoallomurus sp. NPDC052274]|uniref:TetR/AcrR family transcriptional regulator n=1 Tax=Actinoallomurus sp. NPDC052274 TaxID=3155420 RepID=UPI00342E920F